MELFNVRLGILCFEGVFVDGSDGGSCVKEEFDGGAINSDGCMWQFVVG